jgi:serine/threonine protein kinase
LADSSKLDYVRGASGSEVVPLPGASPLLEDPILVAVAGLLAGVIGLALVNSLRLILRLKRQREKVGPYRLVTRLGRGAMGVVWEARHALLRRPTAVKLLAPGTDAERALARFEREVQLTSALTHPCTIAIYDYGRDGASSTRWAPRDQPPQLVAFGRWRRPRRSLMQACGASGGTRRLIHRDTASEPDGPRLRRNPDFWKVLDARRGRQPTRRARPRAGGEADARLSQDAPARRRPAWRRA